MQSVNPVSKPSQMPFLGPRNAPYLTGAAIASSSHGLSGSCPLHPSAACSAPSSLPPRPALTKVLRPELASAFQIACPSSSHRPETPGSAGPAAWRGRGPCPARAKVCSSVPSRLCWTSVCIACSARPFPSFAVTSSGPPSAFIWLVRYSGLRRSALDPESVLHYTVFFLQSSKESLKWVFILQKP